jgi:hypothetical protein
MKSGAVIAGPSAGGSSHSQNGRDKLDDFVIVEPAPVAQMLRIAPYLERPHSSAQAPAHQRYSGKYVRSKAPPTTGAADPSRYRQGCGLSSFRSQPEARANPARAVSCRNRK